MHMQHKYPGNAPAPLPNSEECRDQLVEKIKNEEAYQNRKCISRGLSEGFIRPVAALLRTWVAPHADWLIKVAVVSLQVRRSGVIKEGYKHVHSCVAIAI